MIPNLESCAFLFNILHLDTQNSLNKNVWPMKINQIYPKEVIIPLSYIILFYFK